MIRITRRQQTHLESLNESRLYSILRATELMMADVGFENSDVSENFGPRLLFVKEEVEAIIRSLQK